VSAREAEPLELIAESAAELAEVTDFIASAGLELVAVVVLAQPRADGELLIVFGDSRDEERH
jgi:hypothetical protein